MEKHGAKYLYRNLTCEGCGIVFDSKTRNKNQRFHTQSCAGKHNENNGRLKKGNPSWNKGITGQKSHVFGRVVSEKERKSTSERFSGEKNHLWKGDKAGYSSIHCWVRRWFGRAWTCESCGVTKETNRIEWSNKDGRYSRDRFDWQQLCVRCHYAYDKTHGITRMK